MTRPERPERVASHIDDFEAVDPLGESADERVVHAFEACDVERCRLLRGNRDYVDIAHFEVEAARNPRAVDVDPNEVIAEVVADPQGEGCYEVCRRTGVVDHSLRVGHSVPAVKVFDCSGTQFTWALDKLLSTH